MKITIYGCGYVGLVSGVCLAKLGHDVCCYDIVKQKIDNLNKGIATLYEPLFNEYLQEALKTHKIRFTTDIAEAVSFAELLMISVGTPTQENGLVNFSYLFDITDQIAEHVKKPFILIIRSTVPVGTTEYIKRKLQDNLTKRKQNISFEIAMIPEFLQEGNAIPSYMHADRIIIGTENKETFEKIKPIYDPLMIQGAIPILNVSIRSAELCKYASNAYLAAKISFINELSLIAESVGANLSDVVAGMALDKRIGKVALAGCGFGGSCFTKDIKALILTASQNQCSSHFLESIINVNERQKLVLFNKINKYFSNELLNKVIAIWGLAFKPHTDDIRDASSIVLIDLLLDLGAIVQAYDPQANQNVKLKYGDQKNLILCNTKEEATKEADALVVVTEWPEFFNLDYQSLKEHLKEPCVIFDGRNIYNPSVMAENGIIYFGIGHGLPL